MNDESDISLGIIGISDGNGHPYSFASIINGYNDAGFRRSNWEVIHDYLREKDESDFGFPGVSVTHAWTQNDEETKILCEAAKIPNMISDLNIMRDAVDAVIIARDDPECHLDIALPILKSGTPVFIDKPLTISPNELDKFEPYLRSGQLMSCSGMRYARELDKYRAKIGSEENIKVINGVIIKNWKRYGIHLLDAILSIVDSSPVAVNSTPASHDSLSISFSDKSVIHIDAIHDAAFSFDLSLFTNQRTDNIKLRDNFTAFRRTIYHFIQQIISGEPSISPETTITAVETIIAGCQSLREGRRVEIDEIR